MINADVGIFSTRDTGGNAQHNVSFQVTAPGGYRLDIATSRSGDMNVQNDAPNCDGSADISGITGNSNIALSSGSLSLGDPGSRSCCGSTSIGASSSATIFRVSNNVAQSHTLTFTWNGSVRSNSCEAAVRLGQQNGSTTGCDACVYPGNPGRTQGNDGHFVTVTFTSLRGDGTVDGSVGEQCDQGALNGSPGSCCNANCTLRAAGQTCRPSAGACDPAEVCDGTAPTCPADNKSTAVCRVSAGPCDVAEFCDGVNNDCPASDFVDAGTECRASQGECDPAEACPGNSPNCPPDAKSTAVCRPAAGLCDIAESCDGVSNTCPFDSVVGAFTTCRPAQGACDLPEVCDGASAQCPADAKSTGLCRAAAGPCDLPETCTGLSNDCPPDAKSTAVCRPSAGDCDLADACDGLGNACPPDAKSTAVCRPAVGECDAVESCDGVANDCPADLLEPAGTECRAASDGLGDGCDPCNNIVPVSATRPILKLRHRPDRPDTDTFSWSGEIIVPTTPPIDPLTKGIRVVVYDSTGAIVLDATIPGGAYNPTTGAGWRANGALTTYQYKNKGKAVPLIAGITKVKLQKKSTPGLIRFGVRGKKGTYPVTPGVIPLKASLVIDSPQATTGQCGESTFTPPDPGTCAFNSNGTSLQCR